MCQGFFEGAPQEMTGMISPWAERLGQQTAGAIGQGMGRGATPMPQELFGQMMGASQVPGFAYGPLQYLAQMFGGGMGGDMPWQPTQFNPMDLYSLIYPQRQQQQRQPQRDYAKPIY